MTTYSASYSPDDNKLRLYAGGRLDAETYQQVKAAGFKWAPKQDLFVAPMWTPAREDLLIGLAGDIGDEDKSLTERAEERAERFDEYREHRSEDAERAHAAVASIADNIPLGQPILVGHHSERRARKDAEKIENGMRRAVKAWSTAEYWKRRAAGAIHHAKYKELPAVRARRIKTIEADKRKQQRNLERCESMLNCWKLCDMTMMPNVMTIANNSYISRCFTLAEYPRDLPASQYEGEMSLWGALDHGIITAEQAKAMSVPALESSIAHCRRWIEHYNNRLAYECAMLADAGYVEPVKPKKTLLPICNYRAESFKIPNQYRRNEIEIFEQVEMTSAEYAKIYTDYRGCRIVENSHRVRICLDPRNRSSHRYVVAFLTDSKVHAKPEPKESPAVALLDRPVMMPAARNQPEADPLAEKMAALKDSLKAGVVVVSAPQLFPTPNDLAVRMVDIADIQPGHRVLEPSAGTGNIVNLFPLFNVAPAEVVAVEINHSLAESLRRQSSVAGANQPVDVRCSDFLSLNGELGTFDRIIMNPPFDRGSDIKHIRHAYSKLRDGGRLVAICANGPRQKAELMPMVEASGGTWEELPPNTFAGTGVNTVLLVLEK